MKKFKFRLQKVLEYRQAMEQWAQDAYLDTRVARLEAEASVMEIVARRKEALATGGASLDDRRSLEATMQALDFEEHSRQTVVEVLKTEEEKALEIWNEKKRELDALLKLREQASAAYDLDAARHEQRELDEWSSMRRGA